MKLPWNYATGVDCILTLFYFILWGGILGKVVLILNWAWLMSLKVIEKKIMIGLPRVLWAYVIQHGNHWPQNLNSLNWLEFDKLKFHPQVHWPHVTSAAAACGQGPLRWLAQTWDISTAAERSIDSTALVITLLRIFSHQLPWSHCLCKT